MATFVLTSASAAAAVRKGKVRRDLSSDQLIASARWYTRVRWIAAAVFAITGALFLPSLGIGERLGIQAITRPMWALAAFLAAANVPFYFALRRSGIGPERAHAILWAQILVDLLSVTYLVHVVGSVDTFIAFFYLLHITLSCIALSPSESLGVALIATLLYLATVTLETVGVWPHHAIIPPRLEAVREHPALTALFAASAVFLWFVIWYFISTIAQSLRTREREVREANARLVAADEEKNRIMIQTTHDLKSPFFGIESNIQLLSEKLDRGSTADALRALERIRSQSKSLRSRIDSILLYNQLRSSARRGEEPRRSIDLAELLDEAIGEVRPRAEQRGVSIRVDTPHLTVECRSRQLGVLIENLVSNAVAYSHIGGQVEITARDSARHTVVAVSDEGIGIREDALPRIFEEYFRTREALSVNRSSTGLGLAIVKEVALRNALEIRVASVEGNGTTFEVLIPKETHDGKDLDIRR